jgi:hypothetical protein
VTSQEYWDLPRWWDCNTELWFTGADRCIHCDGIRLLAFNSNDGRRHRSTMVFFILLYDQCQLKRTHSHYGGRHQPVLRGCYCTSRFRPQVLLSQFLLYSQNWGWAPHSNHCALIFQAAVRRTDLCHAIVLWMDWSLDPDGSLLLSTGPAGMILNATIWDWKAFVAIVSCTV